MWGEGALGELASAPLHPRLTDPVNALAFDPADEALWAGTEGGLVCQLVCPSLELYSSFPAHQVGAAALLVLLWSGFGCWVVQQYVERRVPCRPAQLEPAPATRSAGRGRRALPSECLLPLPRTAVPTQFTTCFSLHLLFIHLPPRTA